MLASHAAEPVVEAVAAPDAVEVCHGISAFAALRLDPKRGRVDLFDIFWEFGYRLASLFSCLNGCCHTHLPMHYDARKRI
jgi:hypothetical protein